MALKKKCTDRWHIFEEAGPNGKGCDYISDKRLLSEYAKPMGGVNLTSMDAFRLAGSKMHDSIELKIQEYQRQKIIGSIFKRVATNESPERCDKCENARGYFFGDKLKIMWGETLKSSLA